MFLLQKQFLYFYEILSLLTLLMDCLFNKKIPTSTKDKIILRPTSKTFITGLAGSYDEKYPKSLSNRISVEE